MKTDLAHHAAEQDNEYLNYRALSSGAVASLVLGILSVLTLLAAPTSIEACLWVCPIPLTGLFVGLHALSTIRRTPDELTGWHLAIAGTALSSVFLVSGMTWAMYIYATEVPEGYARISFTLMQPDDRESRNGVVVPEDILQHNDGRVFIKGYMRPSSQSFQLDEFLLVRDNNECCFGAMDKVKYYDRIHVRLVAPRRLDYRSGIVRVGGILHIAPKNAQLGPDHTVFTLQADHTQ